MPTSPGVPSVTTQATAVSPPRGPTGAAGSGMVCLVPWATLLQPRLSKVSEHTPLEPCSPGRAQGGTHGRQEVTGWLAD